MPPCTRELQQGRALAADSHVSELRNECLLTPFVQLNPEGV